MEMYPSLQYSPVIAPPKHGVKIGLRGWREGVQKGNYRENLGGDW